MENTITFSELNSFYQELDSIVSAQTAIEIVFTSTPPNSYSDLWKRLSQCKGWGPLIQVDYMQARPEIMPIWEDIQALAALVPIISNFLKHGIYRKYRLTTEEHSMGKERRILLQPKTKVHDRPNP